MNAERRRWSYPRIKNGDTGCHTHGRVRAKWLNWWDAERRFRGCLLSDPILGVSGDLEGERERQRGRQWIWRWIKKCKELRCNANFFFFVIFFCSSPPPSLRRPKIIIISGRVVFGMYIQARINWQTIKLTSQWLSLLLLEVGSAVLQQGRKGKTSQKRRDLFVLNVRHCANRGGKAQANRGRWFLLIYYYLIIKYIHFNLIPRSGDTTTKRIGYILHSAVTYSWDLSSWLYLRLT